MRKSGARPAQSIRADVRPPRLKEVAEAAGVHFSTASRALNEQTSWMVHPETLERVRAVASDLGYRVNGVARGLKTSRSMAIGMVVPDITNPFFPPAVRGAEERLAEAGLSLLLSSTDNVPDKARRQIDAMLEARVDGLLLAMAHRKDPVVGSLRAVGIPVVLLNRTTDQAGVSAVVPDDRRGVRLAVDHLYELGHRRIGFVGGPRFTSNGEQRLTAFRRVTRRLELSAPTVDASLFDESSGYQAARTLLDREPDVTAVIAGNDMLALGVLDAAAEIGLVCPRDLSVVGFNDMPLAGRLQPPLTTIFVEEHEVGSRAADLLLTHIREPQTPGQTVVIPVELVVRGSTAPPRSRRSGVSRRS
jgi:LacI family transcriptional regulator